ncbi:P-loop containing nucleoside triphosphate hydrolase protein [Astrocystis sublimbata]|nr:P-loop containing nucleoside triphosphate hydrolase protein [Astrocystis sublimbata]
MTPALQENGPRVNGSKVIGSKKDDKRLPVTLLSGFLGAGKSTLLERILTADHGLRIAVIVNDVGELNIDAAILGTHGVTRTKEQVVSMQNGCICCTLRGDLLEEVARLAENGQFDYLLIESSGVSEPQQVAETFAEEFAEMSMQAGNDLEHDDENEMKKEDRLRVAKILKDGGLSKLARLDTCVTLVDAVNFMSDFATADVLKDRQKDVPEEDDRHISDLQVEQIEFADVVVINKCDLVAKEEANRVKGTVKNLNPDAVVIKATKANFDIRKILDTHLFSYFKAQTSVGWLQSMRGELKPETEEYGIGTFVYRARRPFHPDRLWHTIKDVFVVSQMEYEDMDEGGDLDGEGSEGEDSEGEDSEGEEDNSEDEDMSEASWEDEESDEEQPQLDIKARLASKSADKTFGPLLRSKGFLWLATRNEQFGEWSQAGIMLTISGGGEWRATIPESEWPEGPKVREALKADFQGEWGDRRQEIVFIGQEMRKGGEKRLRKAFDACLLTNVEFKRWEMAMRSKNPQRRLDQLFMDGFEDWPSESDHAHHDHN